MDKIKLLRSKTWGFNHQQKGNMTKIPRVQWDLSPIYKNLIYGFSLKIGIPKSCSLNHFYHSVSAFSGEKNLVILAIMVAPFTRCSIFGSK